MINLLSGKCEMLFFYCEMMKLFQKVSFSLIRERPEICVMAETEQGVLS